MDSINLSATHSMPLNCRNTASNTSPIACACCGSKDYVQNVSQANYFRTLYPGTSRCKHSQDGCEDNCVVPPFFPSVPLLRPFFHNYTMPANGCFTHGHFDDAAAGLNQVPEQNQIENEKRRHNTGEYYSFGQKEKRDLKGNKPSTDESTQKNFGPLGTQAQLLAHPFFISNSMDPQLNPCIQRCACGDSTPWTCSPFIVPIVSYCLFWNSQKFNSILPGNYPGSQLDMLFQQHNEMPPNLRHSSSNENEGRTEKNSDINANNTTDTKNYSSEDSLGNDELSDNEWKTNDKSSVNSSLLTSHSLNLAEDNSFNNIEKKNQITHLNNDSNDNRMEEVEVMEVEGSVAGDQVEIDESLKIYEKTPCNSKEQLLISLDSNNDYLEGNESRTQYTLQSEVDDKYKNCSEVLNASRGELPSLKRSYWKIQDSDEERGKITPEYKATTYRERMSFKKFIKNFTITDQTSDDLSDGVQISASAAGDLGGENCVGYKVYISPSEGDQQEKIRQETQTEANIEAKEALLRDSLVLKEKESENFCKKNAEESTRNSRFKSGIAKPSSGTKLRDTKELNTKKDSSESCQEESYVVKRKHSCFPSDGAISHPENSSKIQKTKNCVGIQQQNLGPVKLKRTLNNKSQLEQDPALKARPHSIQKQSNALKNWRK